MTQFCIYALFTIVLSSMAIVGIVLASSKK
jgi:hypothetical protein